MSEHTPGPWEDSEGLVIADEHCVATIHSRDGCGPEFEANARLIAAAPDLLEALKDAMAFAENSLELLGHPGLTPGPRRQRWAAAIAKAEGGAS